MAFVDYDDSIGMGDFIAGVHCFLASLLLLACCAHVGGQEQQRRFIFPEQRVLQIRDPSQLPRARLPEMPPPRTVVSLRPDCPSLELSLDDCIRTALANAEVVRVLAGVTATSSGRTIYDAAISNTQVDRERAQFDPSAQVGNIFNRRDTPQGIFDPADPTRARIVGSPTYDYQMSLGVSKPLVTGGTAELNVAASPTRQEIPTLLAPSGAPLNPESPSSVELRVTQPLLQGAGARANLAPMVIARIETERSFFQTKDAVQELVRGVIEAYWMLVAARTELWARHQQVEQGLEAFRRAEATLRARIGTAADVAQARASLANFRANLITAQANVLAREAALRNILGLPPSDGRQLVPVTPVATDWLPTAWEEILSLAAERRPDLIELKLILEADQERLALARNQALPRADAVAAYRWNGLEGRMPNGQCIASAAGEFTGWQLGVNFSVPLGLRAARANIRQQELILMHDRANLEQGLHAATHQLAQSFRNLAQFYEQYRAFAETREAARINLDRQLADYRQGRGTLYLNVLQAITDWGNAVASEAQSLTQYNIELANLERYTGTILETHGVRFIEERYGSIGPLGRCLLYTSPSPRDS